MTLSCYKVLLITLILTSLVYIPQNIARIGVSKGDEILFRAKGTIGSPSVMATFLSSVLLMALGVRFVKMRSFLKTLALIALLRRDPGSDPYLLSSPLDKFLCVYVTGCVVWFQEEMGEVGEYSWVVGGSGNYRGIVVADDIMASQCGSLSRSG